MTISVSAQKDGQISLYVNDSLSSVDKIAWKEVVIISSENTLICFGILSSDCYGLVNYKDKNWTPDGVKISFKVQGGSEKQAWDKAEGRYKIVSTTKDELHLFSLLKKVSEDYEGQVLTGLVAPWINPYFWDFAKSPEDAHRAEKINSEIVDLKPCTQDKLTQGEIDFFMSTLANAKAKFYGGGSKGETESSRIKSRYDFLVTQMADVAEFRDLYDLATQVVLAAEGSENFASAKTIDLSIAKTLELIAIVLGA